MKIIVTKRSKDGLAEVKFIAEVDGENADQAAERGTVLLDKAGKVLKNRARAMKQSRRSRQ